MPPIVFNGTILNKVYNFKYLGHYLTDGLRDHLDIRVRTQGAGGVTCWHAGLLESRKDQAFRSVLPELLYEQPVV